MMKYIDPHVIAHMKSLELKARTIVDGFLVGIHKSPYRGFSQEFVEHRQYDQSDDPRYIDWKVYGRTDRFYLKQFEEERNLRGYVLLDGSRSMNYIHSGTMSKWEYAATIAASLAYLLILNKDAISLTIFDTGTRRFTPPSTTHAGLTRILEALETSPPHGRTGIAKAIEELSGNARRRSFVLVLSDLYDNEVSTLKSLINLHARGNEVVVVQIMDRAERDFPFRGSIRFYDMESKDEVLVDANSIRDKYRETIDGFISRVKEELWKNNIDYIMVDTETPIEKVLYFILERKIIG